MLILYICWLNIDVQINEIDYLEILLSLDSSFRNLGGIFLTSIISVYGLNLGIYYSQFIYNFIYKDQLIK